MPSKNVIKIGRKELLKQNDLDKDPVIDVMLKAKAEEYSFIDLSVYPFRCKLTSEMQIKMAIEFAKKHNGVLNRCHLDASGSMLAKTSI